MNYIQTLATFSLAGFIFAIMVYITQKLQEPKKAFVLAKGRNSRKR